MEEDFIDPDSPHVKKNMCELLSQETINEVNVEEKNGEGVVLDEKKIKCEDPSLKKKEEEQKKMMIKKKIEKRVWNNRNRVLFFTRPKVLNDISDPNGGNFKKVVINGKNVDILKKGRVRFGITMYFEEFDDKSGEYHFKRKDITFGNIGKEYKIDNAALSTMELNNRLGNEYSPLDKEFWVINLLNNTGDIEENYVNLMTEFIKEGVNKEK